MCAMILATWAFLMLCRFGVYAPVSDQPIHL